MTGENVLSQTTAAGSFSGSGLACRRGGRLVFTGLNFQVAPGGALVLRGPNGSGKTTLLRLMAGLTPSTAGTLAWNHQVIDDPDAHARNLRFITHLDAIKPALTVAENLSFWMTLWSKPDEPHLQKALRAFDLERLATYPARLLSAGQRHRLALARLLVAPAPLWLLDEPGNALDSASRDALARAILEHRAAGGMVIVASHEATFVAGGETLDLGLFTPKIATHWSDEEAPQASGEAAE
jgi:heme exporter protein A